MLIGYYVDQQGDGHRNRALQIAQQLNCDVVGFGTIAQLDGWPGRWNRLAADTSDLIVDPSAGGVFHWAPLRHEGHRQRMGVVAVELAAGLDAMVVDSSTEVAALSRLMGVPTVLVAMRAHEHDRAQHRAFDLANLIIATWPESAPEPGWKQEWLAKTTYTGAISRFDSLSVEAAKKFGETLPTTTQPKDPLKRALVVWGASQPELPESELRNVASSTEGWSWRMRSPRRPSPNLWREMLDADVVVTHAGQNTIAEVAAAARPAIVVAQPSDYGEQAANARALARVGACVAVQEWPDPTMWPQLLDSAIRMDTSSWAEWNNRGGAALAAEAIRRLARKRR